jgi:hypothetical protein
VNAGNPIQLVVTSNSSALDLSITLTGIRALA